MKIDAKALLENQNAAVAVKAALAQAYGIKNPDSLYVYQNPGRIVIALPNGVRVNITASGVEATGEDRREVDKAKQVVGAVVIRLAGLILQNKAREALRLRFKMAGEQRLANGAISMDLEV
jgi:hypothetical protein